MMTEIFVEPTDDQDVTIPEEHWGAEGLFVEFEVEGEWFPMLDKEGRVVFLSVDYARKACQQAIEHESKIVTKARIMKVMYQEIEVFEK